MFQSPTLHIYVLLLLFFYHLNTWTDKKIKTSKWNSICTNSRVIVLKDKCVTVADCGRFFPPGFSVFCCIQFILHYCKQYKACCRGASPQHDSATTTLNSGDTIYVGECWLAYVNMEDKIEQQFWLCQNIKLPLSLTMERSCSSYFSTGLLYLPQSCVHSVSYLGPFTVSIDLWMTFFCSC